MKKNAYRISCALLIILFGVQGKNIVTINNEKKDLLFDYEVKTNNSETISKENEPLSINEILNTLYSQPSSCKVENFTLGERGSSVEVEISLLAPIEEAERIVNNIKNCKGFKAIKRYREDRSGTKNIHIIFNNES